MVKSHMECRYSSTAAPTFLLPGNQVYSDSMSVSRGYLNCCHDLSSTVTPHSRTLVVDVIDGFATCKPYCFDTPLSANYQ